MDNNHKPPATAEPAPERTPLPDDHIQHVQKFLKEMYATMVDPVEECDLNVSQLCELLLTRAKEDRHTLSARAVAVPEPAQNSKETK